jgi:hypothetical protein
MIELRGIIQTAMLMARCSGLIIGTDDRKGSIRMKKYLLGMFLPLLAFVETNPIARRFHPIFITG